MTSGFFARSKYSTRWSEYYKRTTNVNERILVDESKKYSEQSMEMDEPSNKRMIKLWIRGW